MSDIPRIPLISFEVDIRPLFVPGQIQCMKSVRNPIDLSRYEVVRANADLIYALLIGGGKYRMPLGGPYWSQENLLLFKRWMEVGCPA